MVNTNRKGERKGAKYAAACLHPGFCFCMVLVVLQHSLPDTELYRDKNLSEKVRMRNRLNIKSVLRSY